MPNSSYTVKVAWDLEAKVWYVADSDIKGLCTEAETIEELQEKLLILVPEMLRDNHSITDRSVLPTINLQTHPELHLA